MGVDGLLTPGLSEARPLTKSAPARARLISQSLGVEAGRQRKHAALFRAADLVRKPVEGNAERDRRKRSARENCERDRRRPETKLLRVDLLVLDELTRWLNFLCAPVDHLSAEAAGSASHAAGWALMKCCMRAPSRAALPFRKIPPSRGCSSRDAARGFQAGNRAAAASGWWKASSCPRGSCKSRRARVSRTSLTP